MRPRRPWLVLACLSYACLLSAGLGRAEPETLDSKEDNYLIDLPPDWVREQARGTWEKDGIVAGATRTLTKLDDGKPAQGQGGQMHLSVTAAPAGKTLAEIADDPGQREILLRFFAKPPDVKSEPTKVKDEGMSFETPAVRLTAKGTALSDSGTELPCVGVLLVAVVKKRLYRLRLVAWTTPKDEEQLRIDLDSIDMGFAFLDLTSEKPPPGERPKEPPPGEGPKPPEEPPKPAGDSEEERDIVNVVQGWRAKKPKKLATEAIDHAQTEFRQAFLRGNDSLGSCDITLDVYPNGMILDGRKVPDQDIRKFMTTTFWQNVVAAYPKGALDTFPWPRMKGGHFLVPPAMDAPPRVLFEAKDPRPKVGDVDVDMVLKKLRFTEEVKNGMVGKFKTDLAYRGVVRGNREREGLETTIRYAWRTEKFTFFIYATIRKEGAKRYLEPLRQFLESIEVSK